MARTYSQQIELPADRHLDWPLLSRVEGELTTRRERWRKEWKTTEYSVCVAFENGQYATDSVADACAHVAAEDEEVRHITLSVTNNQEPRHRVRVHLAAAGASDSSLSGADLEGTDQADVYGLAEVIRRYASSPPKLNRDPPVATTASATPASSLARRSLRIRAEANSTLLRRPMGVNPWLRDHAFALAIAIVAPVVAALILYWLTGSHS